MGSLFFVGALSGLFRVLPLPRPADHRQHHQGHEGAQMNPAFYIPCSTWAFVEGVVIAFIALFLWGWLGGK